LDAEAVKIGKASEMLSVESTIPMNSNDIVLVKLIRNR
jgi:hypothetical protein